MFKRIQYLVIIHINTPALASNELFNKQIYKPVSKHIKYHDTGCFYAKILSKNIHFCRISMHFCKEY